MKILLSALPRTGSKWLSLNLHLYLKARYKIASELIVHDKHNTRLPITDWFTINGDSLFFDGHIEPLGIHYEIKPSIWPYIYEIPHRLKILEHTNWPMVIKIHPVMWHELLVINSLQHRVQRHYTLRRRDQFDQCVSIMTCRYTNIWEKLPKFDEKLQEFKNYPYTIPMANFENQWNSLTNLTAWLDTLPNTTHLYYEDCINIKTDKDFCQWLDLPYYKFKLDFRYGIEYGEEKKKIISNYEQLKEKYKSN